jgi:hypothetical protein
MPVMIDVINPPVNMHSVTQAPAPSAATGAATPPVALVISAPSAAHAAPQHPANAIGPAYDVEINKKMRRYFIDFRRNFHFRIIFKKMRNLIFHSSNLKIANASPQFWNLFSFFFWF